MRAREIKVSLVESCTATETRDVEIHAVFAAIKQGRWRKQIEKIRAVYNNNRSADPRKAIGPLKKKLPAITVSGRFKQRAKDAMIEHSGYICADLDKLGDRLSQVRSDLSFSAHLFALFRSPSGDGLKAWFKAPADVARHADAFRAIVKHVFDLTGVRVDESGRDPARLRCVSYDPDMEAFEDARAIEPLPPVQKRSNASENVADLPTRQRIAVERYGAIDWQSEAYGFLVCPGVHSHTTDDGKRDCEIYLDGAPTIHCFHNSCRAVVDAANHELRSAITKAEHTNAATSEQSDDDKVIAELAALPRLEYERQRAEAAEKLGVRISVLDKLVEAKRPKQSSEGLQGTAV